MFKLFILFASVVSIFAFNSCTSPTAPISPAKSYTPLSAGLEKQYYYTDSLYQNNKIYSKATREDGQEVYIQATDMNSPNGFYINYSYYFIRNGYYYSTSLIKYDDPNNPYHEMRIGKVYPKDGDSWTLRSDLPDSVQIIFTAHFVGSMSTPAGVFRDVYDFRFYDPGNKDIVHVYYAPGIGNIGSKTKDSTVLLNYVKIDGTELGKQIPVAQLP